MRTIEAYETQDGQIFTDAKKAEDHEIDLIGAELDGLLMHVFKLDINRYSQHGAILKAIKNRDSLRECVGRLHRLLECSD